MPKNAFKRKVFQMADRRSDQRSDLKRCVDVTKRAVNTYQKATISVETLTFIYGPG